MGHSQAHPRLCYFGKSLTSLTSRAIISSCTIRKIGGESLWHYDNHVYNFCAAAGPTALQREETHTLPDFPPKTAAHQEDGDTDLTHEVRRAFLLVPRRVSPPGFPCSNEAIVLLLRPPVSLPHPCAQLVGIRCQQGLAAQPETRGTAGQRPGQAVFESWGCALVALKGGLRMPKHRQRRQSDESGEMNLVKLRCWDSGIFVNEAE